jgi:antitoxin FitA
VTTITITLSDKQSEMLEEIADRFRVPAEALVHASVDELLSGPESEFRRAVERVLDKNVELYRRLA